MNSAASWKYDRRMFASPPTRGSHNLPDNVFRQVCPLYNVLWFGRWQAVLRERILWRLSGIYSFLVAEMMIRVSIFIQQYGRPELPSLRHTKELTH